MDERIPNIFLHFLNKDTQELFGFIDKCKKHDLLSLQRGLNASILLCGEYCFMPLGFYFECRNTRNLILHNLDFIKEGLLRFCIRESELREYVEKKQGQLQRFEHDILYSSFYQEKYTKELERIHPIYLQRNAKVGEYCADKWIDQHNLLINNYTGDMFSIYSSFKNYEDQLKVSSSIRDAASESRQGAFIWKKVEEKYKALGLSDQVLFRKIRKYFEKNYYEVYLNEYHASIMYDLFYFDRGEDFGLRKDFGSVVNYSWFYNFLKCLGLESCLELHAGKIIELKSSWQFTLLLNVYFDICYDKSFQNNMAFLRKNLSFRIANNEKDINKLVEAIKQIMADKKEGMLEMHTPDVLILIATKEEEDAILCDNTWTEVRSPKGYMYYVKTEGLTFALARAVEMRETEVSIMGQYFIGELKPKYLSMVGFCAGEEGKTTLGDVIIPDKIYRYGQGKRYDNDNVLPEIDAFRIDPVWKQKAERFGDKWRDKMYIQRPADYGKQRYRFIKDMLEHHSIDPAEKWNTEEMPDWPRLYKEFSEKRYIDFSAGIVSLTELGEIELKNEIVTKYWDGYKETSPRTKVGVLATGDEVQQWSGIFEILSSNYDRKTIALDMESHAIGSMSSFNKIPYIVAKGVGDYAQDNKAFDNRFITYACYAACQFVINFFNSLDE